MEGMDEQNRKKRLDAFLDFDKMEEIFDRMMNDLFENEKLDGDKPIVMGFSVKMSPSGKAQVERFGNFRATPERICMDKRREPLTDIIETRQEFTVTAEMPGVDERDISLDAKPDLLTIAVNGQFNSFYKEVAFSESVLPKSMAASFKNGILEVRLKKGRACP